MTGNDLPLWTIYERGTDGYAGYTERCWIASPDGLRATDDVVRSAAIEILRQAHQEAGRVCVTRTSEDPPEVVETWF